MSPTSFKDLVKASLSEGMSIFIRGHGVEEVGGGVAVGWDTRDPHGKTRSGTIYFHGSGEEDAPSSSYMSRMMVRAGYPSSVRVVGPRRRTPGSSYMISDNRWYSMIAFNKSMPTGLWVADEDFDIVVER